MWPTNPRGKFTYLILNEIVLIKVFSITLVLSNSLRNRKGIVIAIISASLLPASSTSPFSPSCPLSWYVHWTALGRGFKCLVANPMTRRKLWSRLSSVYHFTLTTLFFYTSPLVFKWGAPSVFAFSSLVYYSFINSFATLFLCQLCQGWDSPGLPSLPPALSSATTSSSLPSSGSGSPAFGRNSSFSVWVVWMVYFMSVSFSVGMRITAPPSGLYRLDETMHVKHSKCISFTESAS